MGLIDRTAQLGEAIAWPDAILRGGIGLLVARTDRMLKSADAGTSRSFADTMDDYPIAIHTADANAQHYELPERFFGLVLGPRRKYSSCLFPTAATSLQEAEELALAETAEHADLSDGQHILELGCGWGSLSLWMAERFPLSRVTSVSNSHSQRAYIEGQARKRGLANLTVVTADMNDFATDQTFDRVVSVEMFEHMSNWRMLLGACEAMVEAGRPRLHSCVQPCPDALSLRSGQHGRLDRAALLHRRHHAEPCADQ